MPRWPKQADAAAFYGNPATPDGTLDPEWYASNIVFVVPPFPMSYAGSPVSHIQCHRKCATALAAVLDAVAGPGAGLDPLARLYSGSLSVRNIRGSQNISMHAFGCAFDFAAERNPMGKASTPVGFGPRSPLVLAFKAQGATWGGDWVQRPDPMHFQFADV